MNFPLYKFRMIDKRLIESLVNNTIYFANPEQLNDPLDCQLDVETLLNRLVNDWQIATREQADGIRNNFRNVGIYSSSVSYNNQILWSHYAEQHKSVCLEYQFSHDALKNIGGIFCSSLVHYGDFISRFNTYR